MFIRVVTKWMQKTDVGSGEVCPLERLYCGNIKTWIWKLSTHIKAGMQCVVATLPLVGKVDRRIPGAHCPTKLAKSVRSRVSERPCLKNTKVESN